MKRLFHSFLLFLAAIDLQAQTVSRLVSWKYDSNAAITGFELIYYAGANTNIVNLPKITEYPVMLNLGIRYDFELRAVWQTVKSEPAKAWHIPLPAPPAFIETNILLTITNAMFWQKTPDFLGWLTAPVTGSQMNLAIESPMRFFRLAGGGAPTNRILIQKTL